MIGLVLLLAAGTCLRSFAAENDSGAQSAGTTDPKEMQPLTAETAAVPQTESAQKARSDLFAYIVDKALEWFQVSGSHETLVRCLLSLLFLVGTYLLRHVVANIIFGCLKKLSSRTQTTLDDKLFPPLASPVAALITIIGIFAALKVLQLPPETDSVLGFASNVAFSLVIFWGLLHAFNVVLDHLHEVAVQKQLGVSPFMPWIKKTLWVIFMIFGVLMIAQNLGADVKTFLAGLGIGGLAFALAAQDALANILGSVVVALDQPYKIGEMVKIGSETGTVEDIGLRSTKIRKLDCSLLVIPNKSVASDNITNLSRFNGRRVEQVLGLTYSTTAAQMEELVVEFRRLLLAEEDIDPTSVGVYFRDFNSSSLDIWIVYVIKDADFHQGLALRQKLNLTFMRTLEARNLSMAFPTRTLSLDGPMEVELITPKS